MKAARFHGIRDLRWEDVQEPVCRQGAVKVKPAFNGICGTDVHEYFDGPTWTPVQPHPLTGQQLPVTFGHEFSATVVEVGEGVTTLRVGDRVAVETTICCGKCHWCTNGLYHLCETTAYIGLSAPGGLADYCIVDEERAHRLPESMTLEQGAVVEPLSVALHGLRRVELTEDHVVAVQGAGAIGIGVAQGASAAGVRGIVVSEPSEYRRRVFESLAIPGVVAVLDPRTDDVHQAIHEVTGGIGVDVTFDAAGAPVGTGPDGPPGYMFQTACETTRRRGWIVNLANHGTGPFQPRLLTSAEIHLTGSIGFQGGDFKTAIERIASGVYKAEGWTQHFAADQLEEAFTLLHEGNATKILIDLPR
jgi:(R,R)-butanediol dehydrogenase/meso-butanediol dehydrogenase/diacetyl reductase